MSRFSERHPSEQVFPTVRFPSISHQMAEVARSCPEAQLRENMSDPEFWEYVLLDGKAPGPDYDIDLDDIQQMQGSPCPECGQTGACAYDADGRPMVHTTEDETEL